MKKQRLECNILNNKKSLDIASGLNYFLALVKGGVFSKTEFWNFIALLDREVRLLDPVDLNILLLEAGVYEPPNIWSYFNLRDLFLIEYSDFTIFYSEIHNGCGPAWLIVNPERQKMRVDMLL